MNHTNRERVRQLIVSAAIDHMERVRYLLEHGADVNFTDQLGQTPLIYATLVGHPGLVTSLLQSGANPNHCNNAGDTVLSLAGRRSTHCCVAVLWHHQRYLRTLH